MTTRDGRRWRSSKAHHPARARLRGYGYFRRLGPGFVTGAADDDPAGIGTYSQVGAVFRFDLLWTAWISLPLASAVQEMAARLGLVSGRGLMALIRDRFARPVLWMAAALVVGANVFNIGADLGSMAEAFRLLVPLPFTLLVIAMAGVILLLEVFVSYERYSLILRWLALSVLAYVIELLVVDVSWSEVAGGLIPSFQPTLASVEALIAIFGTTISPYLFVWQAGEEVEERKAHRIGRVDARQLRLMRVDVVSGMSVGVLVMFAIMVSAASTLGTHGGGDVQTAAQAAKALDLEIVLLGNELEGPEFWRGVRTRRADPANWMHGVAAVAQPALLEDAPRRLLVALSAGVPVIATPACGLPAQDGLTLVPSGDVATLAKVIGKSH